MYSSSYNFEDGHIRDQNMSGTLCIKLPSYIQTRLLIFLNILHIWLMLSTWNILSWQHFFIWPWQLLSAAQSSKIPNCYEVFLLILWRRIRRINIIKMYISKGGLDWITCAEYITHIIDTILYIFWSPTFPLKVTNFWTVRRTTVFPAWN